MAQTAVTVVMSAQTLGYTEAVKRKTRELMIFDSFEEADQADVDLYSKMEPQQRLDLVLELSRAYWGMGSEEAVEGRPRVYRVDELELR